jgi:hypothetical protein
VSIILNIRVNIICLTLQTYTQIRWYVIICHLNFKRTYFSTLVSELFIVTQPVFSR